MNVWFICCSLLALCGSSIVKSVVGYSKDTLLHRCRMYFSEHSVFWSGTKGDRSGMPVPLEISLYRSSVLKAEKNGRLFLFGSYYIVCEVCFFFLVWIDSAVKWNFFHLHRFQGL